MCCEPFTYNIAKIKKKLGTKVLAFEKICVGA